MSQKNIHPNDTHTHPHNILGPLPLCASLARLPEVVQRLPWQVLWVVQSLESTGRCRTQRRASVKPSLKHSSNPKANKYTQYEHYTQHKQHTICEKTSRKLAHCAGTTCMNNQTLSKPFAGRFIEVKGESQNVACLRIGRWLNLMIRTCVAFVAFIELLITCKSKWAKAHLKETHRMDALVLDASWP